jgi:hypothetical protein
MLTRAHSLILARLRSTLAFASATRMRTWAGRNPFLFGHLPVSARWAAIRQRVEQNRRVERWAATGSPQTGQVRLALALARWTALRLMIDSPVFPLR